MATQESVTDTEKKSTRHNWKQFHGHIVHVCEVMHSLTDDELYRVVKQAIGGEDCESIPEGKRIRDTWAMNRNPSRAKMWGDNIVKLETDYTANERADHQRAQEKVQEAMTTLGIQSRGTSEPPKWYERTRTTWVSPTPVPNAPTHAALATSSVTPQAAPLAQSNAPARMISGQLNGSASTTSTEGQSNQPQRKKAMKKKGASGSRKASSASTATNNLRSLTIQEAATTAGRPTRRAATVKRFYTEIAEDENGTTSNGDEAPGVKRIRRARTEDDHDDKGVGNEEPNNKSASRFPAPEASNNGLPFGMNQDSDDDELIVFELNKNVYATLLRAEAQRSTMPKREAKKPDATPRLLPLAAGEGPIKWTVEHEDLRQTSTTVTPARHRYELNEWRKKRNAAVAGTKQEKMLLTLYKHYDEAQDRFYKVMESGAHMLPHGLESEKMETLGPYGNITKMKTDENAKLNYMLDSREQWTSTDCYKMYKQERDTQKAQIGWYRKEEQRIVDTSVEYTWPADWKLRPVGRFSKEEIGRCLAADAWRMKRLEEMAEQMKDQAEQEDQDGGLIEQNVIDEAMAEDEDIM